MPINAARIWMGHSSIEVTARIYTHTGQEVFIDAAEKLTAFEAKAGDIIGDVTNTRENPQIPALQAYLGACSKSA